MSYDLFIFAGEASGDLHGESLLKELYVLNSHLKIKGVGGPKMRSVGMDCMIPMEEFQVMGFIDIISSFPRLYKKFKQVKKEILTNRPRGIITIDYPGFNLRMAKALSKKGAITKRIHYICPTVWAWGKRRIPQMEESLDQLLTILPFETSLFSKDRLNTTYVGHPLISRIRNHQYNPRWNKQYGIENERLILSLFPGSREKELRRNFPLQINTARKMQAEHQDLLIVTSCSDERFIPIIKEQGKDFLIVKPEHSYELMRASHMAIATSGTVALELALHHIPTVVTYAINPLDVFIAQKIFRIDLPFFSLPNIIHSGELFPELFGPHLKEETLYHKAKEFMLSEYVRSSCIEKCKKLKHSLGKKEASKEAAYAIINSLYTQKTSKIDFGRARKLSKFVDPK